MTETSPDILDAGTADLHSPTRGTHKSRFVDLYELTKPRMNFLVVITTAVGYYMAVRHSFEWARLLHTLFGTALTAAGASVLNQFIERKYDALMPRTADRPLPAGRINPGDALVFGILLGVTGVAYLSFRSEER